MFLNAVPQKDRHELARNRSAADTFVQRRQVRLVALKIGFHGGVVLLDRHFDQFLAVLGRLIGKFRRNVTQHELGAEGFILPDDRPHFHQIDDAGEFRLAADRKLQHHRNRAKPILEHSNAAEKVRTDAVHLVDETDARHMVAVSLPPDRLGLRFDAADTVKYGNGPVQDTEGPLDFDREINVAGSIDDVDSMVRHEQVVAAEVMVIPRSCSCSIQSITALPSWTSPIL